MIEMEAYQKEAWRKQKELTRILCEWNRKELEHKDALYQIWKLYEGEALETWGGALLTVEDS